MLFLALYQKLCHLSGSLLKHHYYFLTVFHFSWLQGYKVHSKLCFLKKAWTTWPLLLFFMSPSRLQIHRLYIISLAKGLLSRLSNVDLTSREYIERKVVIVWIRLILVVYLIAVFCLLGVFTESTLPRVTNTWLYYIHQYGSRSQENFMSHTIPHK